MPVFPRSLSLGVVFFVDFFFFFVPLGQPSVTQIQTHTTSSCGGGLDFPPTQTWKASITLTNDH